MRNRFLQICFWGLGYTSLQAQIFTEESDTRIIPQPPILQTIPKDTSFSQTKVDSPITQEEFLKLLSLYNKYQSGKVVYICPPCKFPDIYLSPYLEKKFPDLHDKQVDWDLFDPFVDFLINTGFSSQKHLYDIINSFLS
jgi:hypothetical protein